jgi:hypothetical protein
MGVFAPTTALALTITATSLVSSANPSVFGQSVTFTAQVEGIPSGTPTGTVGFYDSGTQIGSGTLSGGTATFTTSSLSVGTHTITAVYNGNSSFSASTSNTVDQTVNAATTTTALSSSANPSVAGQSVTFTATVTAISPGSGTPTGTVGFYDSGTQIGSGTLSGGTATFTTSSLSVAGHTIAAMYNGNSSFNANTSNTLTQTVNVASTTTALSSSANPSVAGQSVTFTATVTANAPGTGNPTGSVSFSIDGGAPTTVQIQNNGGPVLTAILTTSTLSVGSHTVKATYNGSTNFAGSSGSLTPNQVVNAPPSVTSISPNGGPPAGGTSVTITGTNLTGASAVAFGGTAATQFSVNSATSITATSPAEAVGTVDVTVTTGNGTSATSAADHFSYASPRMTQQGPKLVGSHASGNAEQGASVSLSADGNTAIVGGPHDNADAGAAWIFSRNSALPVVHGSVGTPAPSVAPAAWTQTGTKLVGTGASVAAQQGYAVALSADGNTAIVGGYKDNSGVGAVWIFARNGKLQLPNSAADAGGVPGALLPDQWSQQGEKLVAGNETGAGMFGVSVALSTDGNTAIVGGDTDSSGTGAAWIFTRSHGVWSEQAKLIGSGATGNAFQGISVALSSDGNTALVGGNGDNTDNGAAWVFVRNGTTWSQQGLKLLGSGNVGAAEQGYAVALSLDGNTALVGGFADNVDAGAVWIFSRSGVTWTQVGSKLVGTGAVGAARQGFSVALSGDASTAAIAGYEDNAFNGAVWVFTQSSGTWTQFGSKLLGSGAVGPAEQGSALALSTNGTTLLEGGAFDNAGAGAAWVFVAPGAGALTATPNAGQGPLAVTFSASGLVPPMTYTVNFGDGTVGALTQSACIGMPSAGGMQCAGSASHTYTNAGAYVAALLDASGSTFDTARINVGNARVAPLPVGSTPPPASPPVTTPPAP